MSTTSGPQPPQPSRRSVRSAAGGARGSANAGKPRGTAPAGSRRKVWLKRIPWILAGLFLFGLAALGVAFAAVQVPNPNELADAQTTIVYYDDGKTEMARIAELNRESVPLSQVPEHVRKAVIAAEDRDFYSNSGVSPSGIARSVWQALKGADVQGGGSTITQQYVKDYFLTQDRTLDRKLREMVIAIKIDKDKSKDEILEGYLNTIYFGRGAYGIQTAAKAYFNKDVSQLTVAEGAVLASVINAPSLFDPALGAKQQTNLTNRVTYVLDGMVSQGWLTAADRAAATMPQVQAKAPSRILSGPTGYIAVAVRRELATKLQLSNEDIDRGGLRITTTINKKAQDAAIAAVEKNMPKTKAEGVYAGLVAVRPGDGAIVAMYGGADYQARQFSSATDAKIPAGSTFKPFTLIAALQQGISIRTTFDGSSPMKDASLGITRLENYNNQSFGTVDLRKATASSINTAYIRLNAKVGPTATKDAAIAAGMPADTLGLGTEITNVLGTASPRVVDIANSYATIAAEGRRATAYLVKQAVSPAIGVDYTATPNLADGFSKEVAADTIDAMQAVTTSGGSGSRASQLGRPSAGKTGTSEERKSVWFAGFTPQLSTAVAMFKDVGGVPQPLTNVGGMSEVASNGPPLSMWLDFMKAALDGEKAIDFPKRAGIGDDKAPTHAPQSTTAPTTTAPDVTTEPPASAPADTVAPTQAPPQPSAHWSEAPTSAPAPVTTATTHPVAARTLTATGGSGDPATWGSTHGDPSPAPASRHATSAATAPAGLRTATTAYTAPAVTSAIRAVCSATRPRPARIATKTIARTMRTG